MEDNTLKRPRPSGPAKTSPWLPLYRSAFRALWLATLISNIGGWMQDMGAAWLMTSLTPSPVFIAMVQAAASLPMFFLSLPAGALADIVERRRLLLVGNLWALAAVSALSYFTLAGRTSPGMLLGLTFAVGLGEALEGPAFQAVVTELVPRSELQAAVSLNSAGYNVARAVGPALGGLVVAKAGAGLDFLLNALAFLGFLLSSTGGAKLRENLYFRLSVLLARCAPDCDTSPKPPNYARCWFGPGPSSSPEAHCGHFCRCWCASLDGVRPHTASFWVRSA
jgi:MFS family permease